MTLHECTKALIPVGSLYNMPPERLTAYAQGIHEALRFHTDLAVFALAIQQVMQTAGHYQPKPADYLAAIRTINRTRAPRQSHDPTAMPTCSRCGDTQLVNAFCIRSLDNADYVIPKPCPKCRATNHNTWAPPHGWIQYTEREWNEKRGPEHLERFIRRKEHANNVLAGNRPVTEIVNLIFRRQPRPHQGIVSITDILPTTFDPESESE